jgi:hypothetical protein
MAVVTTTTPVATALAVVQVDIGHLSALLVVGQVLRRL